MNVLVNVNVLANGFKIMLDHEKHFHATAREFAIECAAIVDVR